MKTAATRTIQQQIDELRDMPVSRLRERIGELNLLLQHSK